ncbi:MAG: PQQ-binding-like beta-propeller repeat protein [Bacteroidales bacterium]|nr:PQQ-binding-like beta-propeller repeat protein [Bacteroidales bacterium]
MNIRKLLMAAAAALVSAAGLAAQENTVRFAFFSDTHYSEGSGAVRDLSRCVKDVNTLDNLDFVLVGGDLTDFGTDEEITAVKQILDSLRYKYYVVAGNHDAKWSESGCNTFLKVFGYENFEFECKGWRFIGCNCGPDMRMAPALIPQESMEWLKGLKPGVKTVFVNHYPQDTSVLNYFDVTRELKRIGTRFELGGHWHSNVSLNYDGIPGALNRSTLTAGKQPGYNVVMIQNDSVTISERRLYGSTTVQLEPWYTRRLAEVRDTVTYDADGLPASYPWMRYDVNNDSPVSEVWRLKDDSNIVAGFAMSKGKAWYTTASGYVRCISVKDGGRIWSKRFPGKIFSTPAVQGKYLVFGCTDGNVYALNARNGKTIWKYAAGKSVLGSPVIFNGKVYVGASDGCFRAIDLKSGKAVWTYSDVQGFVECRAFVDKEQVVFGSWGNRLYSLDPQTGSLQWEWKCEKPSRMYSPAAVWPVKAEGKIFIAVPDRRLYALDAATGNELRHYDKSAREAVGVSPDGKTVYCKSMWHTITSVDAATLGVNWQTQTGAGYEISPTPIERIGDEVIMPTDKGNIIGFSAVDGSRLWVRKVSIALVNPMKVWSEKGSVYILASTMDGTVTLLRK